MLRDFTVFILVLVSGLPLFAQNPNEAPKQTARQALIEMLLGKGPNDFVKHLPEETRRTLIRKGDTPEASWALRLAELGHQIGGSGQHVETFDTGPAILVTDDPRTHEKLEVLVEHDSLMGESDEIELSIRYSKDGKLSTLPVVPRLIFTLQEEKEIWRLTEVTAAAHMPLTDPDYLKGLRRLQDESNENMVQMRVGMIVGAEKAYAAQHPDKGFVCNLSTVFEQSQTAQVQLQPQQNQSDDASGTEPTDRSVGIGIGLHFSSSDQPELWNGYRFTISGCSGTPASKYLLTAAPSEPDPDSEAKIFCTDESGTIKFVTGGKPSSCMSNGQLLSPGAPAVSFEPSD